VKFNEALSLNKDLRKDIDSLRQERSTFDGIYRKMEKQLQDRKKAMSAIIEASNKAYEARDAAQMEVAAIQQAMSREKQEFEEAIVALNRWVLRPVCCLCDLSTVSVVAAAWVWFGGVSGRLTRTFWRRTTANERKVAPHCRWRRSRGFART
jgi:predicted  nucleic acid-binding Zn-ribbon protein